MNLKKSMKGSARAWEQKGPTSRSRSSTGGFTPGGNPIKWTSSTEKKAKGPKRPYSKKR